MQNRCLGCLGLALPGGSDVHVAPQSLCLEDVLTSEVSEFLAGGGDALPFTIVDKLPTHSK